MKFTFKIIVFLILIGVLPLILSYLLSFSLAKGMLEDLTFLNLERMNKLVAIEIGNLMAQAFDDISILSNSPVLTSDKTSIKEKSEELKKAYKYYSLFRDISILDGNGKVITSTTYRFYGRWEENYWFQKARKEKKLVASDAYAALDPKNPILAFFSPILDKNNQIKYFIVAQIDTDFLWKITDTKIGEKGYIILVNSRGDIIAHPQRDLLFDKISPTYNLEENTTLKKGRIKLQLQQENLLAYFSVIEKYREYPGHNWHLILVQPEKEALSLIMTIGIELFIFVAVILFGILLISFTLGKYITKPLTKLSLAAKEIASGNLEIKTEIKSGDEFEELSRTFNEMIKSLKKSREAAEVARTSLEIKVKARTKELEELTLSLEEQVKARTKELEKGKEELQKRVEELERFHRLTVGRERRMIELKKEIDDLKKQLKTKKGEI